MSKLLAHNVEAGNRTEDVNLEKNVYFESMILPELILKGLTENGFKRPSPIQLKAIPVGLCGFDLVVKSKAGTGKTLVFTIVALDAVNVSKQALQVLVLAPTREIAIQIQGVFQKIGTHITGLKVESFIGGLSLAEDKEKSKSCHVAIGTPGRIKHLITDKYLKTNSVKLFILDEADKLVESSFLNDINEIYNSLPARKQIITTSATYPNNLQEFLSRYMLSPTFITVELNNPFLLGIKQFVKIIEESKNVVQQMKVKNETLLNIFLSISFTQCLVFTNYQNRAESISNILNQKGWQTTYISAAQSQVKRLEAINSLKDFKCRILLTTDLTARGIDASNVDLVINYDIPNDPVTYLHRMGRTGRYGSSGICINIASANSDLVQLQKILGAIGGATLSIPQLPEFAGTLSDLLKIEIAEDKYIFGIVGYFNLDIRKEILTIKNADSKGNANNEGENDEVHKDEECSETNKTDIMKILKDARDEINVIREHIEDMSTDDILASLASGDFNIGNENKVQQATTSTDVDMTLVKDILSTNTTITKSKENLVTSSSLNLKQRASSSNEDKLKQEQENLISKNTALFEVAKILVNKENAQEAEVALNNYLGLLKQQENQEISKLAKSSNITDILGALENPSNMQNFMESQASPVKIQNVQKLSTFTPELENIFQLGYEKIVKKDGVYKSFIQELGESFSSMECESTDGIEMEEEGSNDTDAEPEIMKWVPVKNKSTGAKKKIKIMSNVEIDDSSPPNEQIQIVEQVEQSSFTETSADNYEHFSEYFNNCSEELWQYGLCFDSVSDFDNWYQHNWQARLNNVREYVQQNIYVQEMSKFQNSVNSKQNLDK